MERFQTWFEPQSVYLLPDGTPVRAQYFDADGRPRWWFVEVHAPGRMRMLVAAVLPNGSVWNYSFQPDCGLCVPQYSDLTIDDLRPTSPVSTWVQRSGAVLALLWAVESLSDMMRVALAGAAPLNG